MNDAAPPVGSAARNDGATLVWFRQDLRLRDNPALHAAAALGKPVLPVYIWSPEEEGQWRPGAASKWWLHYSLHELSEALLQRGSRLTIARGPALGTLQALARATGASTVLWNRRYEPCALATAGEVAAGLRRSGMQSCEFNSTLLTQPGELLNQSGKPYQVFTAFLRNFLHTTDPVEPLPIPRTLRSIERWPPSLALASLNLLPAVHWDEDIRRSWRPGEVGAHAQLSRFLDNDIGAYREARDRPGQSGTSHLSPHLHFGEIGPRQLWHALGPRGRTSPFLHELAWREFAHHLLYHFPHTPDEPLRAEFRNFPWRRNRRHLAAWQRGRTGIPLVDAGMRELWSTGWMHNRVRMVSASLLVKNLLIPWQDGARWFWDTLVDADLANNTLNWQWVAGCGADAAPYFRMFNPLAQAQRFDPEGRYIRKWVPELTAEAGTGVGLPRHVANYPAPIVDLKGSREAALRAYEAMRDV